MFRQIHTAMILAIAALGALSCSDGSSSNSQDDSGIYGGSGVSGDSGTVASPSTYNFTSRFDAESSVAYSGQTQRHLMIAQLKTFIGAITDQTYADAVAGDVVADLELFYDFPNAGGTESEPISLTLVSDPPLLQQTVGDIGTPASLRDKMPDIERVVSQQGEVYGALEEGLRPSGLVQEWFRQLETLVLRRTHDGVVPKDPDGSDITKPYVAASGIDYKELIIKYLLGAVAFSQAADKYLDHTTEGQGLLADNTEPRGSGDDLKNYTALEHVWDEGFGYFGAARDYSSYTDEEIAAAGGREAFRNGYHDSNGDGAIDLSREHNWGASVNAAKRDRGAKVETNFSKDAFAAFVAGRQLIATAAGELSVAQLERLKEYRDAAIGAWEKTLAATAVHYINDVLQDMGDFDTDAYSFLDHAKHWSELKGFALSLQFNPHSPLRKGQFNELQTKIGERPVLQGAEIDDIESYKSDLLRARSILQQTYDFDVNNMGDDNGNQGW